MTLSTGERPHAAVGPAARAAEVRPAGAGPARLRDVAAMAGVSIKTVSRVINASPGVSAATRALVETAIEELSYHPDPIARSLRQGSDATIGLVVENLADPFFAELAEVVEETLARFGLLTIVSSTGNDAERERAAVTTLVRRNVRALLIAPTSEDSLRWLDWSDVPVFFFDRKGERAGSCSVVVDEVANARAATEHLIAHGHRRIAFLSPSLDLYTLRLRWRGFREALAGAGLEVDENLERTQCADVAGAERETVALLGLANPPTAMLGANTLCSLGMLVALHNTGNLDVAHLSYGDFALAESLVPAVSVIAHDGRLIGEALCDVVVRQLGLGGAAAAPGPEIVSVTTHLLPRGSGEIPPRPYPAAEDHSRKADHRG